MTGIAAKLYRTVNYRGGEIMARTVNGAFDEFRREHVDLDPDVVLAARASRDNLLENIKEFDDKGNFFDLCQDFDLHFGSFSRKTKCRELDDIDLMIGIAACEATYNSGDNYANVHIYVGNNRAQRECANADGTLNSTLVLNRFKKELEKLRDYSRSEVKRDHEAINLNLISRDWAFDIVPCFHTVKEIDGRDYYLIPNGKGDWKKTEPRIEQNRVIQLSKKHNGKVRDTIRLVKYWNKRGKMPTMTSYVLETMILDYFERESVVANRICERFVNVLEYIANHIYGYVADSKNIEGNINNLEAIEKNKLFSRAKNDCIKGYNALQSERAGDLKKAINLWSDIFGNDFPTYG